MARADKRTLLNDLTSETEEAAGKGEHGRVYKITKMICCKFCGTSDVLIKAKEGKFLMMAGDQEAHWAENFRVILNRPPPVEEIDAKEAEVDLDINIVPPEKQEILAAIESLKNGKAPRQDNLNSKLFKGDT